MFEEEGRVEAPVSDARGSAGADGRGLGVQDAELLVKLLRYLTRKLHQVAAVELPVSPVEPGGEFKSGVTSGESRRRREPVRYL